ncbi:hypothetical protein R1T16_09545 [Flavobacterium sp. DG1-102-2]|uniref:hypothetical protein n=1 Tax=Flavobacterium sp. DG1-102-2 TaxID=3081663 RepID=UPI002949A32E|nr:hypothetical protein [Flavobacterium sp. DG1-102-2]MDV6168667.1 hypothetical protein [Flavobacterium sp. DG1-102-2]
MCKLLLTIVLLFVLVPAAAQNKTKKEVKSSREQVSCWEAKSNFKTEGYAERNYKILLRRDSIFIGINDKYKYGYKLYRKNTKTFFKGKEEEFVVNTNDSKLTINYAKDSLRIAVAKL